MKRNFTLTVDNLHLPGEIYFPGNSKLSRPALCLCHGIPSGQPASSDDAGYPGLAEKFCAAGFITLIFSFRGAGEAQGNLDMLGWTRDLMAAIDYLAGLEEVDKSRLYLLGSSAGAAVSVYVAANDPRVSSLITFACPAEFSFLTDKKRARATIDHFRTIGVIKDTGFPPSEDEWLNGFSTVSPLKWIDKISPRSLLLIHGEKDDLVPVRHARELFRRAGEPKKLVIIPGAGHRLRLEPEAVSTAVDWLRASAKLTSA
ncbi:MAG: alpha/beta fold hydrolase [Dehalococcoidia bacterium]|nr:alpha/beta fold hydrolase [Dehalococcoidia bacterium]